VQRVTHLSPVNWLCTQPGSSSDPAAALRVSFSPRRDAASHGGAAFGRQRGVSPRGRNVPSSYGWMDPLASDTRREPPCDDMADHARRATMPDRRGSTSVRPRRFSDRFTNVVTSRPGVRRGQGPLLVPARRARFSRVPAEFPHGGCALIRPSAPWRGTTARESGCICWACSSRRWRSAPVGSPPRPAPSWSRSGRSA